MYLGAYFFLLLRPAPNIKLKIICTHTEKMNMNYYKKYVSIYIVRDKQQKEI